ncbi:ribonuclease H-like domain-containing protein [Tanacetum coccineum]|uniref:Ribonuclease H-like domain-containing protein n=1 Tax=Tanacetum coccineum TaxID=301880 RepID=A0ABQ4WBT3_9ASTR
MTNKLLLNRIKTYLIEGFCYHTHNAAWHTLHNVICGTATKIEGYLDIVQNHLNCSENVFHGQDDELIPVECSDYLKTKVPRENVKDPDPVTRISKLDISDPLHLHPNDTTALTVVSIKLKRTENYQISTLKQNGSSIVDYYHKLNALWKQYDAMIELPKCVFNASESFKKHNQLLKLMQFLIGLFDSYMKTRSSILSREVLPDVRSAYATISSEESYSVAAGSITDSSQRNQASSFVSNVPYRQNIQRNNQNNSSRPSRPNNLNKNRQGEGSTVVCENCGFNGHTIDRCFKIIGYLADFRKKKSVQNFKKQNVSNNNFVGKSSSFGFTDEQMATLISPIKDNKVGKNVQANMARANQHMTYTNKELDNVLDISHLRIKDLNLKNVPRIGDQCEGLYYYNNQGIKSNNSTLRYQCLLSQHDWHYRLGHPAEPLLNVLKDSLQIDRKDNIGCCEICQRAKQTREPFPLSDHTSKSLGDLVHLDL